MSAISLSSIVPQPLSTPSPATASKANFLHEYFKERTAEVQQLKEALKSGDLSAAQQAYNNVVALGNTVLHRDNPYFRSDRGLDFNAIGGALQNGDLSGAKQAFAALQSTYANKKLPPAAGLTPPPATVVNANLTGPGATVVHLSNASGEIVLSSSSSSGAEAASENGVNVVA